jgi:hypothetical protein
MPQENQEAMNHYVKYSHQNAFGACWRLRSTIFFWYSWVYRCMCS